MKEHEMNVIRRAKFTKGAKLAEKKNIDRPGKITELGWKWLRVWEWHFHEAVNRGKKYNFSPWPTLEPVISIMASNYLITTSTFINMHGIYFYETGFHSLMNAGS